MTTIYLTSNSPGEVSTFVRPVVAALRRRHPDWTCQVALVPCPYATGAETSVIQGWDEQPAVWGPWETFWNWLKGTGRGGRGAVCFLGGDPWHALTLKSRLRMPAVAYFPEPTSWLDTQWKGGFWDTALGYRSGDPRFIGDLRVDAVRARLAEHPAAASSKTTVALFPGSRWIHLKAVLGPYLSVVERLAERHPETRFLLSASPFVSRQQLADAAAKPFKLGLRSVKSELVDNFLLTENGTEVEVAWGEQYRVISECDMALSLPGTNTAELAIGGKPTVVPLSARVPVGGAGILGLLDRLPGLGFLKERLRKRKADRLRLIALPNQLAGRKVMPEFLVDDELSNLFEFMSGLLENPQERERIGREAQGVMGGIGAADRFVDLIEAAMT